MPDGARLVAFIVISNAERAQAFYSGVLGLKFLKNDGFALVFEFNGTMLRAGIAQSVAPTHNTVLGWEVPDISVAATKLTQSGIELKRMPGMKQDDLGIWTAPDGSKVAWFQDPDGNWLSISQHAYGPAPTAV
ncbi:MAG: VOC family protein [Acidobacteriaceae bacterium]|nr:VOC family protein [Acidobacteriaceae bacterium]